MGSKVARRYRQIAACGYDSPSRQASWRTPPHNHPHTESDADTEVREKQQGDDPAGCRHATAYRSVMGFTLAPMMPCI
ncbi:MAG: hypothetical protein E2O51_00310 [Gammaproteobacteria bacterium]|nr:MAG: hypothetical protein E2O51_00310 [Gammaproteobacteria bacterium]